jgi:class 3 adenylate cyclase
MNAVVLTVRQPARLPIQVLLTSRLAFGRDCDGFLLADAQASRVHAEFRLLDTQVVVADLASANGTRLNGRAISGDTLLETGDVILLGATEIEVGFPIDRPGAAGAEPPTADRPPSTIIRLSDLAAQDPHVAAAIAPTRGIGTFTIVFSDIEGSTALASSLGDEAWMGVLDRHNHVFRQHLDRFDGREIKAQGDGFMLSFDSARRAIGFAVVVQRELASMRAAEPSWPVHVRLGIHAGEAITTPDGDLFGRHVIVAARIADKAVGGEILVSSLVRELVAGSGEIVYGDSRTVALKGLDEQVVHTICW